MADVQITVRLPAELVEEAAELGVLNDGVIAQLIQSEIDRRASAVAADEDPPDEVILAHLREALVDAVAGRNLRSGHEVLAEIRRELEENGD